MDPNSIVWDAGKGYVPGFGVRRQRKYPVFILKYSDRGKQRWVTIGKFGAPWTVDQARAEAKTLLERVVLGENSAIADADNAIEPLTIAELCDRYMVAAKSGAILTRFNRPKKASTLELDEGRISRHIKPLLGVSTVASIDGRAVKRMIQDITVGKTAALIKTKLRGRARVTGGAATAARVADLLSGIMTWAVEEEIIDRNPVHRVRRFRSEPKQRFLSNEELGRLALVFDRGTDATGKAIHPYAITAIKLLCLTGCRVGEIAGLRWDEVDLEQRCLRLEDTKTGRSLRPIGELPLDMLRKHGRQAGNPFVFPGATGKGAYQGVRKEAGRIFKAASVERATPHTLRHTFASVASGLGYSDGTIAGLLGHRGRGMTSRYVHRPDQAIASAAEAVSDAISKLLTRRDEAAAVQQSSGGSTNT